MPTSLPDNSRYTGDNKVIGGRQAGQRREHCGWALGLDQIERCAEAVTSQDGVAGWP